MRPSRERHPGRQRVDQTRSLAVSQRHLDIGGDRIAPTRTANFLTKGSRMTYLVLAHLATPPPLGSGTTDLLTSSDNSGRVTVSFRASKILCPCASTTKRSQIRYASNRLC